jgi:hypothetical protein
VVDDSALVTRHRELADEDEPMFARVYGDVSDRRGYGQGGQSPRQFRVTRVVEVRLPTADDCRTGEFSSTA